MASVIQICNAALVLCGQNRITSLEDGNTASGLCSEMYPIVMESLTREHPWNFATRRAQIAESTDKPAWGYEHQYQLPDDSVVISEVDTDDDWEVEGEYIVTNATAPLNVKYRVIVDDPNKTDPIFRKLLAYELAITIGPRLTQSRSKLQELREGLKDARTFAKRSDAQERSNATMDNDTWIEEMH